MEKNRIKKTIEGSYARTFLELSKRNNCVIIDENRENPDFLLKDDGGIFGLEVTNIYKDEGKWGSKIKKGESERKKFLRKLSKTYYSSGGKPVELTCLMYSTPADSTLQLIAEGVKTNRDKKELVHSRFEDEYGKFYLYSLPDNEKWSGYSFWQCISDATGTVGTIAESVIKKKLDEKKKRLGQYRLAAQRIVLLLVADHFGASGMLDYKPGEFTIPNSGFDEVYLLTNPEACYRLA